AVFEPVELVALADELGADRRSLAGGHPVGSRLFLDADQLRREHQGGEAEDRHVGNDAVVVGRITLRDGEGFAATLRTADVIVETRTFAVDALDDHHRRVVRLLHLHVAEVPDGLVVQRPVVAGTRCTTRRSTARRPTAGRTATRRSGRTTSCRWSRRPAAGSRRTRAGNRRNGAARSASTRARSRSARTRPGKSTRTRRTTGTARRRAAKAASLVSRIAAIGGKAAPDIRPGHARDHPVHAAAAEL